MSRQAGQQPYVVCIGATCMDEYYSAASWPAEGNKGLVRHLENRPGGMIPNAACVFAGYGVKTYLFDVLNTSATSKALVEDLGAYSVDVSLIQYNDVLPDAKCIIVLTPSDRTILVVDSEKPEVYPSDSVLEIMRNASFIYTTVYEVKRFHEPIQFLQDLKAHGAQIVFDIEASTFDPADQAIFEMADVLFFNEFGFRQFKGAMDDDAYLKSLFSLGVRIVTVTLGSNGSRTYTADDFAQADAAHVDVVDATGAGDTFNSSFVRCILDGRDIHYASRFANAAAGWAVTQMGARGGVNTVENVERLMARSHA